MNKYGKSALCAVKSIMEKRASSPVEAWGFAVKNYFPNSVSGQEKGCPKGAFLGLCENGNVKGVPKGNYTKSRLNKGYALQALPLLIQNPNQTEKELWEQISSKNYNHQMSVVLALFNEGFLEIEPLSINSRS